MPPPPAIASMKEAKNTPTQISRTTHKGKPFTVKLLKKSVVDKPTAAIFVLVLVGSVFLNVSPVWFVILAALVGIVLKNLEVKAA